MCRQKCSTAVRKFADGFGHHGLDDLAEEILCRTVRIASRNTSVIGRILGQISLRLSVNALVAALGSVFPRWIPYRNGRVGESKRLKNIYIYIGPKILYLYLIK